MALPLGHLATMPAPLVIDQIEVIEDRRTPTAVVRFTIGDIALAFTLRSQRRGRVSLTPPEAADRTPGATLPHDAMSALAHAINAELAVKPELRKALGRSRFYASGPVAWSE